MPKTPKLKPLTNTERSQLFRARKLLDQEQKYWQGNWKVRKEIEQTNPGNLLKKWDQARQTVEKFTSHHGKPQTRKYHPDRPATSTERNRQRRQKEKFRRELAKISQTEFYHCNKCGHLRKRDSVIIFIKCLLCHKGKYQP